MIFIMMRMPMILPLVMMRMILVMVRMTMILIMVSMKLRLKANVSLTLNYLRRSLAALCSLDDSLLSTGFLCFPS